MYLVFLIATVAVLLIIAGHRMSGMICAFATSLILAAFLLHHMTDKLPVSL